MLIFSVLSFAIFAVLTGVALCTKWLCTLLHAIPKSMQKDIFDDEIDDLAVLHKH